MRANESIKVPESVSAVMRLLEDAGFECFVVGGYLRDSLLGRPTFDVDLATSATPEDVIRSLTHYSVIPTGIQHGTVSVLTDGGPIEITTFREDGSYSDYRHPDEVQFAKTIEEDLSRRDFTINALAWNEKRGLIDPWGGRSDLKNRVIRTVGDANQRFREDALRIIRGLRLGAELTFHIDEETSEAMYSCKHLLQFVASERLQVELNRLLVGENALSVLQKHTDILFVVIPELACLDKARYIPDAEYNPAPVLCVATINRGTNLNNREGLSSSSLLDTALLRMSYVSKDIALFCDCTGFCHLASSPKEEVALRLAALLFDLDHVAEVLRRLRYDSATIDRVEKLIKFQNENLCPEKRSVWRAIRAYGQKIFLDGMRLRIAGERAVTGYGEIAPGSVSVGEPEFLLAAGACEGSSKTPPAFVWCNQAASACEESSHNTVSIKGSKPATVAIARIANELIRSGQILELKDLVIDGHDLLECGYEGKEIGQMLELILEKVCVEGMPNTRESLLHYIDDKRDKQMTAGS
jgi:tRNA nucleotidyltransferase (CCA-adding enzyme)